MQTHPDPGETWTEGAGRLPATPPSLRSTDDAQRSLEHALWCLKTVQSACEISRTKWFTPNASQLLTAAQRELTTLLTFIKAGYARQEITPHD